MDIPPLSFIVPGFSKCGTTTLCDLLNLHPDIHIPEDKEPLFFIRPNYEDCWHHYHGFFGNYKKHQLLGEGSTFYTAVDHEAEAQHRILKHYPNIKLIFIARDPLDRIESSFREFHHSGPRFEINTPHSLADAIELLPALINDTMYWQRLSNYLEKISPEQVHVLFLEDLKTDLKNETNKCYEFLGLKPIKLNSSNKKLNSRNEKLYDIPLTQKLRNKSIIKKPISIADFERQNKILSRLLLRKPFRKTIQWDRNSLDLVKSNLMNDTEKFLKYCNKPNDFWPRTSKLLS